MKSVFALLLILYCLGYVQCSCITNTTDPYRLPQTMRPSQYEIEIQLNEVEAPYSINGHVKIDITIEKSTSCIILHSNGLGNFTQVHYNASSSTFHATTISEDTDKEWIIISFNSNLPIGEGSISLYYTGYINSEAAKGFFVSELELFDSQLINQERKETNEPWKLKETDQVMFATQFEGPYARMAFPCFDEPSFKAYFKYSFSIPNNGMQVLTNTPLITNNIQSDASYVYFYFEQTPVPISNYLVRKF